MAPTVRFGLTGYDILKEDDGLGGDGVDLYLGWVVTSSGASFASVSRDHGGLKRGWRSIDDHLFDLSIPVNQMAVVRLFMFESDGTTEKVARAFQQIQVPKLSGYNVDPNDVIDLAVDVLRKDLVAVLADVAGMVAHALVNNSDDGYGSWSYIVHAKSDTVVEVARLGFNLGRKGQITLKDKTILPSILKARYVDDENDITARIRVTIPK